jgi:UDP-N-acetylglucosamine 2-epimerase (non-hydrolysing)
MMGTPRSQICRVLLVFGTRPEAIKMAPLLHECQRRRTLVEPIVCATGQHRQMLDQVTEYFAMRADVDLALMMPEQTLAGLTARCMERVDEVLQRYQPDQVVVQGDTSTAMATSLAAFYRRIPLVHVEAGLRTGNLTAPWPEELNRRIVSLATWLHCAPTPRAAAALRAEGASPETIHVTGNTVIDALLETVARERANAGHWQDQYPMLGEDPMVLITAHRRESFGAGLEQVCQALAQLAARFSGYQFVYPVHLNPAVREPVQRILGQIRNVHLRPPVAYPEFVWLMNRATLILTDSGGVQEEAPSLGKPVLVLRDTTERPEAVEVGAAHLVGTAPARIIAGVTELLTDPVRYAACQVPQNPFGDGHAARRIVDLMLCGC